LGNEEKGITKYFGVIVSDVTFDNTSTNLLRNTLHILFKHINYTPNHWLDCVLLQTKQTPWPLVCKQTIPTERLPLVGEI
jgi:hypothetical protein